MFGAWVIHFARHYLPNKLNKSKAKRARGAKKGNPERKIQNRNMVDNMSAQRNVLLLQSQAREEHRISKIMLKIWKINKKIPMMIGESGKHKIQTQLEKLFKHHGTRSLNLSNKARTGVEHHMPKYVRLLNKNMESREAHMTQHWMPNRLILTLILQKLPRQ